VNSCERKKLLHIGAVVNITNKYYEHNTPLSSKNQTVPLALGVYKQLSDGSEQLVHYKLFNAKLGSNTLVEEYWDGAFDALVDTDVYPDFDESPSYQVGNYKVKILLNNNFNYSSNLARGLGVSDFRINLSSASTVANINVYQGNGCQNSCTSSQQELSDKLVVAIDDLLENMNQVNYNDMYAYVNGNFSIAATNSFNKADMIALETNTIALKNNLQKIRTQSLTCETEALGKTTVDAEKLVQEIYSAIDEIKKTTTSISRIPKGFIQLLEYANISFSLATIASSLSSTADAFRNDTKIRITFELINARRLSGEFLKKAYSKECNDNANESNLNTTIDSSLNMSRNLRNEYTNYINASKTQNIGTQDTLAEKLIYDLSQFFPDMYNKMNTLNSSCDECMRKYPTDLKNYPMTNGYENLKCRIEKMTPAERANFRETLNIRKAFNDSGWSGRTFSNTRNKTFGFGIIRHKLSFQDERFVVAISGQDGKDDKNYITNYKITNGSQVYKKADGSEVIAYVAKDPDNLNNTIFKTVKSVNSTGTPIVNDAEIKIFDYTHKTFGRNNSGNKTVDLKIVFSDRVTCGYCQDVVRRIRKSIEDSPKGYNGIISDLIEPNFTLYKIDGKPLVEGEYMNKDKHDASIQILNSLP
jgi:hypothetical protein